MIAVAVAISTVVSGTALGTFEEFVVRTVAAVTASPALQLQGTTLDSTVLCQALSNGRFNPRDLGLTIATRRVQSSPYTDHSAPWSVESGGDGCRPPALRVLLQQQKGYA